MGHYKACTIYFSIEDVENSLGLSPMLPGNLCGDTVNGHRFCRNSEAHRFDNA